MPATVGLLGALLLGVGWLVVALLDAPLPRLGIVDDGTPNAFAFGRTPAGGHVWVSRRLLGSSTPTRSRSRSRSRSRWRWGGSACSAARTSWIVR
jgi:hypothetical protein